MLRVNFPKAFEVSVDREIVHEEHDPFSNVEDKKKD